MAHSLEINRTSKRFDIGLLLLRVFPLVMIFHGFTKLGNFSGFAKSLENFPVSSAAPTLFAVLIAGGEIVLPILIAVGFFTRISALLETAMMFGIWLFVPVMGLINSGGSILDKNGGIVGEGSMMYLFLALPVVFLGAGRYSLDSALAKGGNRLFASQL
ncbi:DoxX family protein [Arcanobacterium hippocoleae]